MIRSHLLQGVRNRMLALRSRFFGGRAVAAILLYHRVIDCPEHPYGMCVSPRNFEEHLALLSANYRVVPLPSLFSQAPTDRPLVAVTFDDGYADNLENALPLLEAHQIPATFFVTTSCLEPGSRYWWDELARYPDWKRLHGHFMKMGASSWATELQRLGSPGGEVKPPYDCALLDRDRVAEMSRHPLVEIGGHTVTHSALPWLPRPSQREELKRSKAALEELTGQPQTCFSYPFGAWSRVTQQEVAAAGYSLACVAESDAVRSGSDRLCLPRIVVEDVSAPVLDRVLGGLLCPKESRGA